MLDIRGRLLQGASGSDDTDLRFRRVEGNGRAPVVCFLPWQTPYRLAARMGVVPKDFLVCYEMPGAIVSSEPDLCVTALRRLVEDAKEVATRARIGTEQLLVLGWSMGSGPATYFANSTRAKLRSIASADRGDLLLWESPVVRDIKERAIGKGYRLEDFSEASRGYHPAENLANLRPGSKFVISLRDEFVPQARRRALVMAVRQHAPGAEISYYDAGHVKTIVASVH